MGDRQWTSMRAPRPAAPGTIREDEEGVQDADVASDITKQKVAAAKNYIEQHYKQRMRTLQERKERRHELERRLEEEGVSCEEQEGALRELEQREAEIEGLRRDTTENIRAQRAELALREAERRARELEMERESLRRGVAKRDQALGLMKRELERSAHMLSAAADTRQALRSMKEQMDWMQEEARAKEQRLAALQEEFVSALKGSTFPSLDKSMLKRRKLPPQGKSNEDS